MSRCLQVRDPEVHNRAAFSPTIEQQGCLREVVSTHLNDPETDHRKRRSIETATSRRPNASQRFKPGPGLESSMHPSGSWSGEAHFGRSSSGVQWNRRCPFEVIAHGREAAAFQLSSAWPSEAINRCWSRFQPWWSPHLPSSLCNLSFLALLHLHSFTQQHPSFPCALIFIIFRIYLTTSRLYICPSTPENAVIIITTVQTSSTSTLVSTHFSPTFVGEILDWSAKGKRLASLGDGCLFYSSNLSTRKL